MQLQHDEIRRIYDNIGMMDEDIKNQSIYTVEDTYIKELKNKYTRFLIVTCRYLPENLLDQYVNITIMDLKYNNQWMNELIDTSLTIDKWFERINDCIQCVDYENTPYTVAQVIQKAHHAVLELGLYVNACKELRKISQENKPGSGSRLFCVKISQYQAHPEAECKADMISHRECCGPDMGYSLRPWQLSHGSNRRLQPCLPSDVNNPPSDGYQQYPGG